MDGIEEIFANLLPISAVEKPVCFDSKICHQTLRNFSDEIPDILSCFRRGDCQSEQAGDFPSRLLTGLELLQPQ